MIVAAVLSAFGDILIYHWAKQDNWRLLAAGVGTWLVSLLLVGLLFRHGSASFSILTVILVVLHLLIDVSWDVGMLGKRIHTTEYLGFAFAFVALLLLAFGNGQK